jgi:hypothetical protein
METFTNFYNIGGIVGVIWNFMSNVFEFLKPYPILLMFAVITMYCLPLCMIVYGILHLIYMNDMKPRCDD